MGKIQILTAEQKIFLAELSQNQYLRSNFYFTGGTALSEIYLRHRYSEDLDFFTSGKMLNNTTITVFLRRLAKMYHFTYRSQTFGYAIFCTLKFPRKKILKVDFSTYPYKQLDKRVTYHNFEVDSLLDITVNKLSLLSQRIEVKDFVDLYFLLQKFSLWDLIEGVKIKFNMEITPFLLASDFLKVDDFTSLPRMIKPLTLDQLRHYFHNMAKELGRKVTVK